MLDLTIKLDAAELNPFEQYGNEPAEKDPSALSRAQRRAIWNDPQRLLRCTMDMLATGEIFSWQPYLRADAETKRKWLEQLRRNNPQRFDRLSRHPNWSRLARKRPVGRQPGRHAPGLAEAWDTVQFIRRQWAEVFGHKNRSVSPTALEIAAGLYGFTAQQLDNYRKNRRRSRRSGATMKY